ncbi:hypothetical protein BJ508DRAFT_334923 [Ascobolus immersus RN42]|uniref:Uncharacterized protein n=1 Tax=Ascobolus immersus RN42 TaxID=1160509 RepID=A0A3N4HEE5_ASCIM|nr:hypothetical protein BJ508DRAFT_334923 [Ascobolus immersus RN42]
MTSFDHARDMALLQSALRSTSTYPSSSTQYSEDPQAFGQTFDSPSATSVPTFDMPDISKLSPDQFRRFMADMNDLYYNSKMTNEEPKVNKGRTEESSEPGLLSRSSLPPQQSIRPSFTTAQTSFPPSNQNGRPDIRVSLPPTPPASVPVRRASSRPLSSRTGQPKPVQIPIVGLFGRVPVTVQEPSPYQFNSEQREKLLQEQAAYIRKQQEASVARSSKASEVDEKITSVDQILAPIMRGLQEQDLVLELNFEIKDDHIHAEPRRYTGPAIIPADLTLDDQKAVVYFMAYFRTFPLADINPQYSWLDFRPSNSCEVIQKIVESLVKGPEGNAIRDTIKVLADAKARRSQLHRQQAAKLCSEARQKCADENEAAKRAMENAIEVAKQSSSIADTDSLFGFQAGPRITKPSAQVQPKRISPDLLVDTAVPAPLAPSLPPPCPTGPSISKAASNPQQSIQQGDLLSFDDDIESEESVEFIIHANEDEDPLVDFSESTASDEFLPHGGSEPAEQRQPSTVASPRSAKLPVASADGYGKYTSVPPPQFAPAPKRKSAVSSAQSTIVVSNSDNLIDLDTFEEEAPPGPARFTTQHLSMSSPPMSEIAPMKPLLPLSGPKVNLLDAYKQFVGRRVPSGSVDLGMKLNIAIQKAQPCNSPAEDATLVATEPSVSPKDEESQSECSFKSLPQRTETFRKSVAPIKHHSPSKTITPKSASLEPKSNVATPSKSTGNPSYLAYHDSPESAVTATRAGNTTPTKLTYTPDPSLHEPSTAAYFRDIYSLEAQKEALAALRTPTRAPTRQTAVTQPYPPSLQDSADILTQVEAEVEKPTLRNLMLHERKVAGGADIHVREWLAQSSFEDAEAPMAEDRYEDESIKDDDTSFGGVELSKAPAEEELLIVF